MPPGNPTRPGDRERRQSRSADHDANRQLGSFSVEGLAADETYIVTVSAPRYHFDEPMRVVSMPDDVTGIDFIGRRNE